MSLPYDLICTPKLYLRSVAQGSHLPKSRPRPCSREDKSQKLELSHQSEQASRTHRRHKQTDWKQTKASRTESKLLLPLSRPPLLLLRSPLLVSRSPSLVPRSPDRTSHPPHPRTSYTSTLGKSRNPCPINFKISQSISVAQVRDIKNHLQKVICISRMFHLHSSVCTSQVLPRQNSNLDL
ncbi:hypothetical protein KC19_VG220900, partial [Ceratodon purpureus]